MRPFSLDEKELLNYQPNRPPFLMIDYVTEVLPGKYANGYKVLDEKEWFFPIHFPGNPNMPGALQLEALAQMLTVAITTLPGLKGKVTHAISHTVKFKKEVIPGRKYIIKTKLNSWNRGICKGIGQGFTDGEIACEAEMTITIPEILKSFLPKTK